MTYRMIPGVVIALFAYASASAAEFDAARAFGARNAIEDIAMSPDGSKIAFITPGNGQSSTLYTVDAVEGAQPRKVAVASGDPERFSWCNWVANDRLVCAIYGVVVVDTEVTNFTRIFAINADGTNTKLLSTRDRLDTWVVQNGGSVVDWLPDEDGVVLMRRNYNKRMDVQWKTKEGSGVERIDTRTLATKVVEDAQPMVSSFISDGRGTVRLMSVARWQDSAYNLSPTITYLFRKKGSRTWENFGDYDMVTDAGFAPHRIDYERDVAYGLMKKDGRLAAYTKALDGSGKTTLIYARPDVDISGFATIGRRSRVIGARYDTDYGHIEYFDPAIQKVEASLGKALPRHQIDVVDSSSDETKLLIRASSDISPGAYYLFDRTAKRLVQLLEVQPSLSGRQLAEMKPITYTARDGTQIPAYLTLPPGRDGKNLPAIVMPHGGPEARDRWDFDWLAQFFAASGYAVIQPQYRGSTGYGDSWFQKNAFRSWNLVINDVLDAGHWLVKQGIADPRHLATVGWSYGGYAALESAVVEPSLFKAVVAIAPVTDLGMLKQDSRNSIYARIEADRIGSGSTAEASPAQHASQFKAPVLLFHGENDLNVDIRHSRVMATRLKGANIPSELVTWPKLDHQLFDSAIRADLLRKSDAFLRKSMGIPAN